ncbi:MAG: sporulation protein [Edaphobacter sp.]|nr:sporulation protein [Edaphobacter sp.]
MNVGVIEETHAVYASGERVRLLPSPSRHSSLNKFPRIGNYMQLWNDYEGRTIAEAYPLEKLLSPEGRSAYFSTSNGTGTPAVIRLIEAHFDEAEILARWRMVSGIKQDNLVTMRKCGQTTLDGASVVYAVMEPTEANLAEILRNRPLTVDETRQLATSLVAALQALHDRNLIHEHIEPANVLAAGEVIKLRSDCIREAPEGQEGATLKARDVHDLAIVLLQALTRQRTFQATAAPLAAPFDQIVRNGLNGTWGLSQIAAAVAPPVAPRPQPQPPVKPAAVAASPTPAAKAPIPTQSQTIAAKPAAPTDRIVNPVETEPRRSGLWIAGAIGVLFLFFLAWYFLHTKSPAQPISTLATVGRTETPSSTPTSAPSPRATPAPSSAVAAKPSPDTGSPRTQWRVVAFTYNHQDQAQQKVDLLAKQNASLNPEVFTPNGRAPYLVTVGGPMSREQAAAFKKKARAAGLPRDTYTQNYTTR